MHGLLLGIDLEFAFCLDPLLMPYRDVFIANGSKQQEHFNSIRPGESSAQNRVDAGGSI